ncbi:hypothetical protein M422DRAFT_248997, partial [Sphaerobolus stellatus SS14]
MPIHPHSDDEGEALDLQNTRVQKRARCSGHDDNEGLGESSSNEQSSQSQMDFWFHDGDIVLAIERMLVRVHKRVLSRSHVWDDMLEIPQPSYIETYDGLPLVKLYGDTANDWLSLLRWLYNDRQVFSPRHYHPLTYIPPSQFYTSPSASHFPTLSGALRLSTKYDFPALRTWCITRLLTLWPPLSL